MFMVSPLDKYDQAFGEHILLAIDKFTMENKRC